MRMTRTFMLSLVVLIGFSALTLAEDQNVLLNIAKNGNARTDARLDAVSKLSDQALLADVAKNANNGDVRTAATSKLADATLLANIAKNDREGRVRQVAISMLDNQTLLADVAKSANNVDIRAAATVKLSDATLLVDIAKNDREWRVRQAAVSNLDDQALLENIATNDKEAPGVRQAAVSRLRNQALLADIVENGRNTAVRAAAVSRLDNQALIGKIALYDRDSSVRKAAISVLNDQAALEEIVENDKDPGMRKEAVRKLTNLELLGRLANDRAFAVRGAAEARLAELKPLNPQPDNQPTIAKTITNGQTSSERQESKLSVSTRQPATPNVGTTQEHMTTALQGGISQGDSVTVRPVVTPGSRSAQERSATVPQGGTSQERPVVAPPVQATSAGVAQRQESQSKPNHYNSGSFGGMSARKATPPRSFGDWMLSLLLPVTLVLCLVVVISIIVDVVWGKQKDPARETYFYWRGDWMENLKAVCRDTVAGNLKDAGWLFGKASRSKNIAEKIMWGSGGVIVILTAFLFLPLFLVPFTVIFLIVFAVYTLFALTVGTVSTLILKIHGIFVLCPHCSNKVKAPVYKCPGCGQEHRRLKPMARYGVLRRKCGNPSCGSLIPTTWLSGKRKLESFCSGCSGSLHGTEAVPVTMAFIGGRSSGKSFLMMDFIYLAQEKILHKWKLNFTVDALDKARMTELCNRFKKGGTVQATNKTAPVIGLCIEIKKPSWAFPRRLFFYDPPGESFTQVDNLRPGFDYYQYLRYVVFVIDPFSYPDMRRQFEGRGVNLGEAAVSTMSAHDTFTTLLNTMEAKYGKMPKAICAVVINKTDVDKFKDIAGIGPGDVGKSCRTFLSQCDGNLVGLLEENLTKCEYFAVSAQGRSRGSSGEYVPEGVENVIEYFLNEMK